MHTIKILICYHKESFLLKDEIFVPIHVGRKLAFDKIDKESKQYKWLSENLIGDDTGDNISDRNSYYNELTATYWAWKNYDQLGNPDYIGLMHYRRHFIFKEIDGVSDVTLKYTPDYLDIINYSSENVQKLIEKYDFICHRGQVEGIEKHYADNHKVKDLHLAIEILKNKYPDYSKCAEAYLKQKEGSFCNMFIFPKKMFFEYCEWLFDILFEFEKLVNMSEKRMFISERLTGIFIQNKINQGLNYGRLPITLIKEPLTIPIVVDVSNDILSASICILSHIKTNKDNILKFYLIGDIPEFAATRLKSLITPFNNVSLDLYNIADLTAEDQKLYQSGLYYIIMSTKLKNVKKCICLKTNILALSDLEEFFRTCGVDDYWICGLPQGEYNSYDEIKHITNELMVVNFAFLRKHDYYGCALSKLKDNLEVNINLIFPEQNNNIPYWFYQKTEDAHISICTSTTKSRSQLLNETQWKTYLCYTYDPSLHIDGIYSSIWWRYIQYLPNGLALPQFDIDQVDQVLRDDHKSIQNNTIVIKMSNQTKKINSKLAFVKKHGLKNAIRVAINRRN